MSCDRVVRQPPQYGGFENIQSEIDRCGSDLEGLDRDRILDAVDSDNFMPLDKEKEDSESRNSEWSRPMYSDASRSPSPALRTLLPSHHPSLKRKASTSLDEERAPRKGTKRSKSALLIPPEVASTMLELPAHTPETREAAFLLSTPIRWTAEQFDAYWPLVDNFWVCNKPNNALTGKCTQSSYWWCRLYRGETVSESHGQRNKSVRRVESCGMKLKMVKSYSQSDPSTLSSVEISLHLDKRRPCWQHNHERDYVDQCKINSFVMNAIGLAVAQGWEVASVHSNIKGVKWTNNLTALEAAGGRYLNLHHCHNAGAAWRKVHPDQRIWGAKTPWPEQWTGCLADLDQIKDIQCANITAKRDIDGETAHGTVFAKKCASYVDPHIATR